MDSPLLAGFQPVHRVNFELKREEEALASGETPPESHLLDAVRNLVEGEDDGGPIFECSWDDIESGCVTL